MRPDPRVLGHHDPRCPIAWSQSTGELTGDTSPNISRGRFAASVPQIRGPQLAVKREDGCPAHAGAAPAPQAHGPATWYL